VEFRWNAWNLDHATRHGVTVAEIERVVRSAKAPYPEVREDAKWRVVGRGTGGRIIQVIYLIDPAGTIYVIHARALTDSEKKRDRRRRR
jgi:uncharacterized DUF497 family protein